MRFHPALVGLLLAAPVAASDPGATPVPDETVKLEVVRPAVAEEAPAPPELILDEVKAPEETRTAAAETATQEMPRRGSFWWMVAVIVVAGLILVVLL